MPRRCVVSPRQQARRRKNQRPVVQRAPRQLAHRLKTYLCAETPSIASVQHAAPASAANQPVSHVPRCCVTVPVNNARRLKPFQKRGDASHRICAARRTSRRRKLTVAYVPYSCATALLKHARRLKPFFRISRRDDSTSPHTTLLHCSYCLCATRRTSHRSESTVFHAPRCCAITPLKHARILNPFYMRGTTAPRTPRQQAQRRQSSSLCSLPRHPALRINCLPCALVLRHRAT